MAATTMLHVRVDDETKIRAAAALGEMGLTVSEAVRVFLRRVAADQALPFDIKVPRAGTRAPAGDGGASRQRARRDRRGAA